MNKKHHNINIALKNFKCNFKTTSKKLKIIKFKEIIDPNKPSCNWKITMNLKKKNFNKRISSKRKNMKRKFSNWSKNSKKNSNNKLVTFNKSMSSSSKNLWLMKWSQKKLFLCCNMNLTSKSKLMKVYKGSILNKKSFMKKNKLNSFKRMNSFPNLSMKKDKACKKESMMFSKKSLRSKNKLSQSLIKKMKLPIFPNKKIKK